MELENTEEEAKIKPLYTSKEGFVDMLPLRGVYGATLLMKQIDHLEALMRVD